MLVDGTGGRKSHLEVFNHTDFDGQNPARKTGDMVFFPLIARFFSHHPFGGWPWDF